MITAEQLIFDYPGIRALNDVSFHIAPGSITALVGPNGAGKTTLLRCLAALDFPVSGNIVINGLDVIEQPRLSHRNIGYLSDFFGLYQRLTVQQSLYYVARAQGLAEHECQQAINDVSHWLGIADRLRMRPGELSRGLRQRVAIAQAIIHQPRVLLLDEPASGLDPEARHELASLFLQLQQRGMTLLVSSHILAELEAYSSDILVLRQGCIVEHAAIKTTSQTKPFKLVLAHAVAGLEQLLQSVADIEILSIQDQRQALLHIPPAAERQHQILQALLALPLPVCEFAPATSNLQDTYLQTVRNPS